MTTFTATSSSEPRRRTRRRIGAVALAFAAAVSVAVLNPDAAYADPAITITHTTTTRVVPDTATTLSGLSAISQLDPQTYPTLQVTITTTVGTISIPTHSNLTLAYSNDWSGDASVTFTGAQADVTAAVASTQLVTTGGDAGSTASVSLTATFPQQGYIYSAPNQHFYQYVADQGITWDNANTAAQGMTFEGQQGYLATIPSNTINDFVSSKIQGAENVWIGAESEDAPTSSPARTWQWTGGPLANQPISYCTNFIGTCDFSNNTGLYSHWAPVEPNNYGATSGVAHSGEYVAVTNWGGSVGEWNDLPSNWASVSLISGYVVEYGNHVNGSTGFTHVYNTSSNVLIAGPPAAPGGVSATRGDHSAAVSFTSPATNGSPITGYTVTTSPGGATTSCSASPCAVTGLTNGSTYTFTARATNTYGTGPASSTSAAIVPAGAPGAPTNLTATHGNGLVTLQFTPPSGNGSAITGYQYATDGANWQPLPTSAANGVQPHGVHPHGVQPFGDTANRTATITGLTNGTRYIFRVRAVNGVGPGAAAGPVSSVPGQPTLQSRVPDAPRNLRVHPGDRVLTLRFDRPVSDGGSPITKYRVSLDGGRHWRTVPTAHVAGTANRRTASMPGVLDGKTYRVKVRAVNRNGAGPATRAVQRAAKSWFHDQVSVTSRRHEVRVPPYPVRDRGTLRWTTARGRAHNGATAMAVGSLHGRQLQRGQAAALSSGALFAFDSATLSRDGRAAIKSLVRSLRYDKSVVCEGYADYGWRTSNENSLSRERARAVCAALTQYGAHVRTTTHGYGSRDPVIVGGTPAQRAANRRVVVLVTG